MKEPEPLAAVFLRGVARQLAMLTTEELERHVAGCRESVEHVESVGCLLDPTGYREALKSGSLDDARHQLEIAKHLLAAQKAIDKREEFVGKKHGG